MTNVTIDLVDGEDDASGRCTYTVLQEAEPGGPIEIVVVGRYDDRYHRGADGWHLTDRLFHIDLSADQSRHLR
jgi:hypothetical protein